MSSKEFAQDFSEVKEGPGKLNLICMCPASPLKSSSGLWWYVLSSSLAFGPQYPALPSFFLFHVLEKLLPSAENLQLKVQARISLSTLCIVNFSK